MSLLIESVNVLALLLLLQLAYAQIDESRRQRNPFEFYQIGPESPPKEHYHLYLGDRLSSIPAIGTSDYVRYFARQTSGENINNLRHLSESESNNGENVVVRRVSLIDSDDNKDPHSSHRNFITAGNNRYYSVQTPQSHEPQAPIVGHYYSSHQDRHKGGKLYLGNRPFYF